MILFNDFLLYTKQEYSLQYNDVFKMIIWSVSRFTSVVSNQISVRKSFFKMIIYDKWTQNISALIFARSIIHYFYLCDDLLTFFWMTPPFNCDSNLFWIF